MVFSLTIWTPRPLMGYGLPLSGDQTRQQVQGLMVMALPNRDCASICWMNLRAESSSGSSARFFCSMTCCTHLGPLLPIDLQKPSNSPTGTSHNPMSAQNF